MADQLSRTHPLGKLKPALMADLCMRLNMNDQWRKVASCVRYRRTNELKYTQDYQFCQLERSGDPAKAVIRSLYPDNRSIGYLIDLLKELNLYREANVLCDAVGEPRVQAKPVAFCTEDIPIPSMELTSEIEERARADGRLPMIGQPNQLTPSSQNHAADTNANQPQQNNYDPLYEPIRGFSSYPEGYDNYEQAGQFGLDSRDRVGVGVSVDTVVNKSQSRQNGQQSFPQKNVCDTNNQNSGRPADDTFRSPQPIQQNDCSKPDLLVQPGKLNCVRYEQLVSASKSFSECIGRGGFGEVYFGKTKNGTGLAIKRLFADKGITKEKFRNEVDNQAKCIHKNIAPVYAVCDDGLNMCIVYPYMPHGTLRTNLASPCPMRAGKRFRVAKGTSAAIHYLHTIGRKPLLHLDITSSNILLDDGFHPKLSDFGQVRYGPALDNPDKTSTTCLQKIGTAGYMPWEFVSFGSTSKKTDIYCFGVVLMEILSGLKHFDESRTDEEKALIVHVLNNFGDDIKDHLDTRAGQWSIEDAQSMYTISLSCCEVMKEDRPEITEIYDTIQKWKEVDIEEWM